MTHTQITIIPPTRIYLGDQITYRIERNGLPFGILWTYSAPAEYHGWHVKLINHDYAHFDTLAKAQTWIEEQS